jgi:hypothetical protein
VTTITDGKPLTVDEEITWQNIVNRDFYLPIPEPDTCGPVWQVGPLGTYLQPKLTLGWQILDWVGKNLLSDETDDDGNPKPFAPTPEQQRLILWWYEVDERGRFACRKGVIQRIKGWGKDPFAAVLMAVEFVGPCRFAGWLTEDRPDLGLVRGDPLAKEHPKAWIQVAAVSQEQTVNTMSIFPGLFTEKCIKDHGIDMGKEKIYAHGGQRRIQAVTSSPRSLEGGRPTFVVKNETHHWLLNNDGHAMAKVLNRNLAKSKGGQARSLSITNAYDPTESSVAQTEREAWEAERDGLAIKTGVFYDSVEAGPDAKIVFPRKPDGTMPSEAEIKAYIGAVINSVRGDAWWLDIEGLVNEVLGGENDIVDSQRFYYNRLVTADDAWVDPTAVRKAINALAAEARSGVNDDDLGASWAPVSPDDPCVMFFDGSKSRDSTALVGCRLDDGYTFLIGVWARPLGERGAKWLAPRAKVDARVRQVMGPAGEVRTGGRFNIVGFFGDPSHAKDDEDSSRYWDGLIDKWHIDYKDRLQIWATKSGNKQHSIMWDMTSPERSKDFTSAAELFVEDMETKDDIEEFAPSFEICGHPAMVDHLRNARRYPNQWGTSLWKGAKESGKKIDIAVCAVGARMVRRLLLNVGLEEDEEAVAELWGKWTGLDVDQYTEGRW